MLAALFAFGLFLATPVDFQKDVAPILEAHCTSCHHDSSVAGHLDLTSRAFVVSHSQVIYSSIESGAMPPGGKLSSSEIEIIGRWIKEGAYWPQNYVLKVPAKPIETTPASLELDNVRKIRERIVAQASHKTASPYSVTLPNTTVSFEMVPIPAGKFVMGSSGSDPMHKPDEQPSHQVTVEPFWMQAHEVTWDEYRLFMFARQAGEIARKDDTVDAVSRPTRPYVEMSFGMGINGFPAISMTQHAANKYAEWLSAKTGEFYRLPTEAEWEYACRAGTTTDFYFGNDASQLKDYAWYSANSGGKYQKVATKKPNTWGLYDMLGNVMEWTLDAYAPYKSGSENDPWVVETQPYPTSVRGGSWNDPAGQLTCASRVASDPSWKQQDPQLPKSIWYETDAQWLGFRLIRPVKLPSVEAMFKYWNSGVEHDEQ
jgi:formylglycine-generating enzyme required for sulfatase activity